MAETKDETTVENVELNDKVEYTEVEEKTERAIDPNLQGIQLFYEKNKKMITYVGGGLLAVVAALVYWNFSYLPAQEKEASNEILWAQKYFDIDSFKVALNGGRMVYTADGQKQMLGFAEVAEQYGMTKNGNLANYYAGICNLRLGNFEAAIENLGKYSLKDEMIAPLAVGAMGDACMELNKIDEAVKYYLKASEKSENYFTTPYFLKKAAFSYELQSNFNEALKLYERIEKEYGNSEIGKEIDKEIARVKATANL
jgi:tetratricopeptide (TPR) repeat protein